VATRTNDQSNQRSAVFANERRSVVPRQEGRIGDRPSLAQRESARLTDHRSSITDHQRQRERVSAFTLLELLIVLGIVAMLMLLIAPAFTTIKGGTDVTSAAYTIKGVLDTARTYAKANNTYTWVGFYEEDVSGPSTNPASAGTGRIVMSVVASKDGTYGATSGLIQVDKLTKVDNVHLTTFTDGSGQWPGTTFDTRPPVTYSGTQYSLASMPDSATPFTYPLAGTTQYTFRKAVQFSSSGEARINNNVNSLQTAAEIGVEPTHGNVVPGSLPADLVAIQFTGVGGNVNIYRR
jgi:Tfp pilus assembly protein FimT